MLNDNIMFLTCHSLKLSLKRDSSGGNPFICKAKNKEDEASDEQSG